MIDLHLLPTSPCLGAGVYVGLAHDRDGVAITGLPDIGAYEYKETPMSVKKTVRISLEVTAAPDFFPASVPLARSAVKGVVAVYNVSFTAAGGYTGPVALAVVGLPAGAVGTFSKPSINVGETSVLSITTEPVALGLYPVIDIEVTAANL